MTANRIKGKGKFYPVFCKIQKGNYSLIARAI